MNEIRAAEGKIKGYMGTGAARKAIEAAKKAADRAVKAAENEAKRKLKQSEERILAMQRDFERLPLLRQVNDVFELIVSMHYKNVPWRGGLNVLRPVNKRLNQVAESLTTKLTENGPDGDTESGPASLPTALDQGCMRIVVITSHNLGGCTDGLKCLYIEHACHLFDFSPLASCSMLRDIKIDQAINISDLSPLASCSRMESLEIWNSSIADISVVASMPLLKAFQCQKVSGKPSIKDLSPLASCPRLKNLSLSCNTELKDLSPLSACTALETLDISDCPLIISLGPLSALKSLRTLYCNGIDPQTSLLPLASCTKLMDLECDIDALHLKELRRKRPDLRVVERKVENDEEDWEGDEGWESN
jgi:hypothetical protein